MSSKPGIQRASWRICDNWRDSNSYSDALGMHVGWKDFPVRERLQIVDKWTQDFVDSFSVGGGWSGHDCKNEHVLGLIAQVRRKIQAIQSNEPALCGLPYIQCKLKFTLILYV